MYTTYSRLLALPLVVCGVALDLTAKKPKPAYFHAVTLADGAQFVVRLEDPNLIQEARDIIGGITRDIHISGTIVKAPAAYNSGWSFHLDPGSVDFFSVAAEVCDASTVMVEQDLEKVGGAFLPGARWCPWSSRLVGELKAPSNPILTVVSAASLSEVAISPTSLASVMGEDLTNTTESAQGSELPTKLAGVQVEFRRSGSSQNLKAPLLLASPERINFTVPADVRAGLYTIRLIRDNEPDLQTATRVENVAPGVFFGKAEDIKYAAASLLRLRADGSRSEESLLSVDQAGNYAPVPVDFGSGGDRLYLSLYGSGIGTSPVSVRVGSVEMAVLYSGPQGSVPGLDQINIELSQSLSSLKEADVIVAANNSDGQSMKSVPVKLLLQHK